MKISRQLLEKSRIRKNKRKRNHEVLYFHKVDDPYSHLTIQFIEKFKDEYSIDFIPILVGEENPETLHEPDLYIVNIVLKMLKEYLHIMVLISMEHLIHKDPL